MNPPLRFTVTFEIHDGRHDDNSVSVTATREIVEWRGREGGQAGFGWCVGCHLGAAFSRLRLPLAEFKEALEAFEDCYQGEEWAAANPLE